jgi:lipoate-protein ligase A
MSRSPAQPGLAKPGPWIYLPSGAGEPAFNMALDEALLEAGPRLGGPVLRFYGWTQPAASFGYFQKFDEVRQLTPLRPLIRRPTGGGIVPHEADWTYSLVFPPDHNWYGFSARESYRQVHLWIQMAFATLDLETALAPVAVKAQPGQCFVGYEQSDLLWRGRKIAGAAQRRRKDGLLIQGSVQPPLTSLVRSAWEKAMLEIGSSVHGADWIVCPEDTLTQRATDLAQSKYSQPNHNQRR